jgi:hypothetical protein
MAIHRQNNICAENGTVLSSRQREEYVPRREYITSSHPTDPSNDSCAIRERNHNAVDDRRRTFDV